MVEKLLEFLVYKVDPELFKGVALKSKNFKIELILKLLIVFSIYIPQKLTSKISNPAMSSTPM